MKIGIVGPTHPYKGGIALHTTTLAHTLVEAGHEVTIISWSAQYPKFLYPGEQRVDASKPETEPFEKTEYLLAWNQPYSWRKAAKILNDFDLAIFTYTTAIQVPSYLTILKFLHQKVRTIALCHNVLPHELKPYDKPLAQRFLRKVDAILVHSNEQADLAKTLTSRPVLMSPLPPHLPKAVARNLKKPGHKPKKHLLFFGLVRPYKGVDVLLEALASVPEVTLTVAGEIWGRPDTYRNLAAKLGIIDRVTFTDGYVPAEEIAHFFLEADALVLPYRSGTASQNILFANAFKIPVIATKVGSFANQIHDGVDGILCEPDDSSSLIIAIEKLYETGTYEKLASQVNGAGQFEKQEWNTYIATLLHTP